MAPSACVVVAALTMVSLLAAHAAVLVTTAQDLQHASQALLCRAWLAGTCVLSSGFLVGWGCLAVRCLRCGNEFRDNHRFCHYLRLFLAVQGTSALTAGVILQACLKRHCEFSTWTLHVMLQYGVAVCSGMLLVSLCLIRGPASA